MECLDEPPASRYSCVGLDERMNVVVSLTLSRNFVDSPETCFLTSAPRFSRVEQASFSFSWCRFASRQACSLVKASRVRLKKEK